MGTLEGFAPPFGPPPATAPRSLRSASPNPSAPHPPPPPRSLRSASRDGAPPAEPAGSPRDYVLAAAELRGIAGRHEEGIAQTVEVGND
jgi:hypothetical protein